MLPKLCLVFPLRYSFLSTECPHYRSNNNAESCNIGFLLKCYSSLYNNLSMFIIFRYASNELSHKSVSTTLLKGPREEKFLGWLIRTVKISSSVMMLLICEGRLFIVTTLFSCVVVKLVVSTFNTIRRDFGNRIVLPSVSSQNLTSFCMLTSERFFDHPSEYMLSQHMPAFCTSPFDRHVGLKWKCWKIRKGHVCSHIIADMSPHMYTEARNNMPTSTHMKLRQHFAMFVNVNHTKTNPCCPVRKRVPKALKTFCSVF